MAAKPWEQYQTAGTAAPPEPPPAAPKPQKGPWDAYAPPAPVAPTPAPAAGPWTSYAEFDKPTAEALAEKDHAEIFAHAAQFPEHADIAFEADKLRRARGIGAKVIEGVGAAATPATWWNAAKGVGNFLAGFPQVAANVLGAAKTSHPAIRTAAAVGTLGQSEFIPTLLASGLPSETIQAENTLAAQHGEQALTHMLDATVGNLAATAAKFDDPNPELTAWRQSFLRRNPKAAAVYQARWAQEDAEMRRLRAEDIDRQVFNRRLDAAKKAMQLAEGRPLETGAIAELYKLAGHEKVAEDIGPEALKAAGLPPVRQAAIARMAAATDPNNILLAAAPGVPGAATVGGGATELVGKTLRIPGMVTDAVTTPITSRLAKIQTVLNPAAAAKSAAAKGGARGLAKVGEILEQQGKELRTGTPSPLTTKAATAAVEGERAIGTNLQRKAGDVIAHGAQTAAGIAPLNLALAEGDPKAMADLTAGAAAFGGVLSGFRRNRAGLVEGARPHLRSEGARSLAEAAEGNDPLAAKSAAFVMSMEPEARDRTLEAIGTLQGLPLQTAKGRQGAKLYVLSEADYLAQQNASMRPGEKAAMEGGRGFFYGPDGAAYINGEYHTGLGPAELSHTIGHEFGGHAAINVMLAAGARGGALHTGLMSAARENLMPGGKVSPGFQRFINAYNLRFDPTGQTKRLDPSNPESIDEFISETAGQIFAAKGAGEIALPKNLQDRVADGIGRFMASMMGFDPRIIGTKTHFDREEIASLNELVQETLSQVAGMKLREGQAIPESPKTDTTRIAELETTLTKPRPPAGSPLTEVTAWRQEQRAARTELNELQEGTPEGSAAPKPETIVSPMLVTADAVKALGVMGISKVRANALIRQANQAHGAPITDAQRLTQAALRLHGGGTVKPGEFTPKPATPAAPVPIPVGEKAIFEDPNTPTAEGKPARLVVIGKITSPLQVGNFVITREGEIRRVTRVMGDTVDTARPIDDLNARGTKTHKLDDVQGLATDYAPEATPASATTPPAGPTPESGTTTPPEAPAPALRVVPAAGGRFKIVDAADNPTSKNTYATERDAQQAIARTGKPSTFDIPPSADGNDVIDQIMEATNGKGIYLGGDKEGNQHQFPHQGIWRNKLIGSDPFYAPDKVAQILADDFGRGAGDIEAMFSEITKAIEARKSLRDQIAAEEKRQKQAAKNAPPDEQAPPEPTEPTPEGEGVPPRTTTVVDSPVAPENTPQPTPLRADELSRIAASAEKEAVAAEIAGKKKLDSQTSKERVRKAKVMAVIRAHSDRLPLNHQGLRLRTDQFGKETVTGKIDPAGDFDNWLASQAGLSGNGINHLLALQDAIGKVLQYDYRHGSTGEGGVISADTRRSAQKAETAQQRAEDASKGEIRRKTSIPLEVQYNVGANTFTVLTASPEKLLSNFNRLTEAMQALGETPPYRDIHDRGFQADMAGYIRNHANGWQGDGTAPMVDAQGVKQKPTGEPYKIDDARFEFLNAVLGDEGAKASTPQGKEKSALAQFNARMVNPTTGETNALRERINAKLGEMPEIDKDGNPTGKTKPWSRATLENPISENIRPDLVEAIHPETTKDDTSIRPAGYRGDVGAFFKEGIPDRPSVAAGFMPKAGPKEKARERITKRSGSEILGKIGTKWEEILRKAGAKDVKIKTDERSGAMELHITVDDGFTSLILTPGDQASVWRKPQPGDVEKFEPRKTEKGWQIFDSDTNDVSTIDWSAYASEAEAKETATNYNFYNRPYFKTQAERDAWASESEKTRESRKGKWILTLHDTTLPDSMQGKGVMTKLLSEARKIVGKDIGEDSLGVHMPSNAEGWRTISRRAGLEPRFMPKEEASTPQEKARERLKPAAGGKSQAMPYDNVRKAAIEAWKQENGEEPITSARAWWVDRHGNLIPIRLEHSEINDYVGPAQQSKDPVGDAIKAGMVRATTDLGLGGNSPDVHFEGDVNPAQRRTLRDLAEDRGGKLVNPGGRDSLYFMPKEEGTTQERARARLAAGGKTERPAFMPSEGERPKDITNEQIRKYAMESAAPSKTLTSKNAWITSDGQFINVDQHKDGMLMKWDEETGDIAWQASYGDLQDAGLGRVVQYGNTLYLDHPKATPKQIKELKDTAIENGWTFKHEKPRFEMFMPTTAGRERTMPEGFFSQLQRTIEAKMPASAPAAQVLAIARGGSKAEELKWSDIDGAVKRIAAENGGKVPKQALLDHLATDGAVRFKEATLSENQPSVDPALEAKVKKAHAERRKWIDETEERLGLESADWPAAEKRELSRRNAEIQELTSQETSAKIKRQDAKPKFAQHTLPGGKNYREIVLTMDSRDPAAELTTKYNDIIQRIGGGEFGFSGARYEKAIADRNALQKQMTEAGVKPTMGRVEAPDEFTSSHFPESGNYIAHLRLADHQDAQGREGTLMEEAQSDLHQKGREKGYKTDPRDIATEAEISRFYNGKGKMSDAEWDALSQKVKAEQEQRDAVPDAPMRRTWHEYLFRRALQDAVATGKQWIGWTTGETQADRYDLSKQIKRVDWQKVRHTTVDETGTHEPGTYRISAESHGGQQVIDDTFTADKLPDVIGKELAEKIVNSEESRGSMSGLDLKVGGEGMKGFYDTILRKYVDGYVKKWGGKVEKGNVKTHGTKLGVFEGNNGGWEIAIDEEGVGNIGETFRTEDAAHRHLQKLINRGQEIPIWQVEITPAMREAVKAGQPMFMPNAAPGEAGQPARPDARQNARSRLAAASQPDRPETVQMSNASLTRGPQMQFLPAHHGTPHKVDKFSVEKIGTGEGAQVYGWGLYFAENPTVGKVYQKELAERAGTADKWFVAPTDEGKAAFRKAINYADAAPMLASQAMAARNVETTEQAIALLREEAKPGPRAANEQYRQAYSDLADMLEAGTLKFEKPQGNLYTVDIDAQPHELIDYDKPISQQDPKVQEVLKWAWERAKIKGSWVARNSKSGDDPAGREVYEALANIGSESSAYDAKAASEAFASRGIVGIQYLDQGSRKVGKWAVEYKDGKIDVRGFDSEEAANTYLSKATKRGAITEGAKVFFKEGEQTRNYVVFDDSRITITHENGEPVTPKERRDALGQRQSPKEAAQARQDETAQFMPIAAHPFKGVDLAKIPENEIIPMEEWHKMMLDPYVDEQGNRKASSKTTPQEQHTYKVGQWRRDRFKGSHGREIEQLRLLDPRKIERTEDLVETNTEGRGDDSRRYQEWWDAGKTPPPIEVVETEKGNLKVVNGHRRHMAALRSRRPILAWVSPTMDHPQGWTHSSTGDIQKVGMTHERVLEVGSESAARGKSPRQAAQERMKAMPADDVVAKIEAAEKDNGRTGERKVRPQDLGLPYEDWRGLSVETEDVKIEIPVSSLKIGRDELNKSQLLSAHRLFQKEEYKQGSGQGEMHVIPSTEPGKYVVASNGNHRAAILLLTKPDAKIKVTLTRPKK